MSNGAPSADAKSCDGRASRDGGRDHTMSRGVMSCDGATSIGKASNGRTMMGGMTSGAAITTLGAVIASSEDTLSHNCPLSDGTTSHCAASNGRIMTGGNTIGAVTTALGAEVASSDGTLSHNGPMSDGTMSHGEASNGRIMTGGMTSGAATTLGAEASASATGTIGAMTGAMTGAARGNLSTAVAGSDRRCTGRKDATHECAMIAPSLSAAPTVISTSLNHIHAANLWNKLGKQRVERRHEERLEQLALLADCSRVISDSLARDPSSWSVGNRSQLHQWQLWLSLERGADGQQHLLPASERQLCRDAMVATIARPSGLQRSVADALADVQVGFEEEHLEPRTGYSLDLALPSSRVAVEVDGPFHFLLPDGRGLRRPNGPTLLKRRLLAAAGWRVISVPFYEWDGFATAKERQTYLQGAVAPLLG
ncbi:hypothetical protein EMIHUDRAFT_204822 [Emiliania huxleyi CCMP1516]|uniref:RAP domain-containing protein n=2 Tax=Emiliania huxleyi TaxID=2903 RepID=A0A0D3JWF0_EMIH1|nr:hypothetical protein EMIHUDRAFT_204822 [Emiliania huxleyi CCMP1516]EOD27835.1 hypothetical protein EMIHUDRAFT_204822 [Emiliania huxleyi CCMP1516]|eukprot:XP_005780264.1 hypothetical protein EMIHUDRAFT_204822 [Emiliania huxleyi CCMP1516]